MTSPLRFTLLLAGASFVLSGCYTQLATVEDDGYRSSGYYEREYDEEEDSTLGTEPRRRYYTSFQFYYPWRYSFYWGAYDPWYWDTYVYGPFFYDPWYYHPWHRPYYYSGWYGYHGYHYYRSFGYSSGYYAYYQPYIIYDRSTYTRRESGVSRTGGSRDRYGRVDSYGSGNLPVAGRDATSGLSGSRRETATRNRSTESTSRRPSGSGYTRENTRERESSATRGGQESRGRESSGDATRSGGVQRDSDGGGRQSYSPPSRSSSPRSSSPPASSRGSSSGGGSSNRGSGSTRGNR